MRSTARAALVLSLVLSGAGWAQDTPDDTGTPEDQTQPAGDNAPEPDHLSPSDVGPEFQNGPPAEAMPGGRSAPAPTTRGSSWDPPPSRRPGVQSWEDGPKMEPTSDLYDATSEVNALKSFGEGFEGPHLPANAEVLGVIRMMTTGAHGELPPMRDVMRSMGASDRPSSGSGSGETTRGAPTETVPLPESARATGKYDIPESMRPVVAQFIQYFQGNGRSSFLHWMARGSRFIPVMLPILEQAGLPHDTVYVSMIESGFSADAHSTANAIGPWQLLADTARELGLRVDAWVDERRDPIKSTFAAAKHLAGLYRTFGDWYLAWAAYNAGAGRIHQMIDSGGSHDYWQLVQRGAMPTETQSYVPKIIACALVAKNPAAFGFGADDLQGLPPFVFDVVPVRTAVDLEVVARAANASPLELHELNPELLRNCTPPASSAAPYTMRVPHGRGSEVLAALADLPSSSACRGAAPARAVAASFTTGLGAETGAPDNTYKVKPGDTLWSLGQKFHCAAAELRKLNGIKTGGVKPGQVIRVP